MMKTSCIANDNINFHQKCTTWCLETCTCHVYIDFRAICQNTLLIFSTTCQIYPKAPKRLNTNVLFPHKHVYTWTYLQTYKCRTWKTMAFKGRGKHSLHITKHLLSKSVGKRVLTSLSIIRHLLVPTIQTLGSSANSHQL